MLCDLRRRSTKAVTRPASRTAAMPPAIRGVELPAGSVSVSGAASVLGAVVGGSVVGVGLWPLEAGVVSSFRAATMLTMPCPYSGSTPGVPLSVAVSSSRCCARELRPPTR